MLTACILFILLFLAFFLTDIFPILNDWFNRIKIGKYQNELIWIENITKVSLKWVNKTPKVKLTDNNRLILIDIIKGNYSKPTIQHWQEASLILGVCENNSNNEKIEREVKKFLERKFDSMGQWKEQPKHIDAAILAYAVMKIEFEDTNKFKPAFDYIWKMIQDHLGTEGTVLYRKSMPNYRYVDTIGFICPFLVRYGVKYNKPECIDLAYKQLTEYLNNGFDKQIKIPCHAYSIIDKAPQGLYGWGRGLGWFAIGLMDSWKEMPIQHNYKVELKTYIKSYAAAIKTYQQENGSWNWTVTRNEARSDSSTTAILGWFLANTTEIDNTFKKNSEKALDYLMTVTRRSGAVDFSQGDTKDIGIYSNLYALLPFTQGFSLRLVAMQPLVKQDITSLNKKGA
ncbi:glycoside hydrolase family 88 protein [Metabacillus sp. GX 13764]|uniref:glycoside hydrolase family 88 protein n=1 Tax=Metabacillus kandeliae TaxID=2900151 RepID=UPI001E5DFD61|nr:glycoside hydrolase family 88 protein [Metabacillus kandeliae]MCD7033153.1 glycoside hydrolase family 88 protein [Metabacillus kandeliae]